MVATDPESDPGLRHTVTVSFKPENSHRLHVVSQAMFDGVVVGAIETSLLEYGLAHGHATLPAAGPAPVFPTPDVLTSSENLVSLFEDFLQVIDALSARIESLGERGRIAVVEPEVFLDFVRAAAVFPAPYNGPEPRTFEARPKHAHSITLLPQHIELIDKIGFAKFGRDRKRRAVLEEATVWYSDVYGLSETQYAAQFDRYPDVRLMNLNRYFARYILSFLEAMARFSQAPGWFRLWSTVEQRFGAATKRLELALFAVARR